jgi:ATP-binding protein involved in chromosome partitioning
MSIEKERVAEVLKQVIHPATGNNIVDLGYVQDLQVTENNIKFSLVFSNPSDPLRSSIKRACVIAIKENIGEQTEVDISLEVKPVAEPSTGRILPDVKNIIAVASGKGGVGKSTVAVNLAVAFAKAGFKTGLVDADIFGPSVPKMMHAENEKPFAHKVGGKDLIIPVERYGVKVLSIGFFIDATDATIWRGPMASNALRQLLTEADWGGLDYLFIDLPPGTSDIHLTLVQTVSVTGAVIVSTPQNVALADVVKGISMFKNKNINVPVLGIIENMSWFTPEELPENRYYIFGKDGCKKLSDELNVPLLGQIPLVQSICESGDAGEPVVIAKQPVSEAFKTIADNLVLQVLKRNTNLHPTEVVEIKTHRKPVKF